MYRYLNQEEVDRISLELKAQPTIAKCLKALKSHHPETHDHSLRVARLSIDIAIENRLPVRMIKLLGKAALLHDFGKYRIDTDILSKNGALDEKELALIRQHPRLGLVELENFISERIKRIIISHHEFKQNPYPRQHKERRGSIRFKSKERRRRDTVSMIAQIVAAADMYDALSFSRSYKKGFELGKVKHIMEEQFTGQEVLISQLSKRIAKL